MGRGGRSAGERPDRKELAAMLADKHPVVFIVFNRPEVTKIVFERIRQARPGLLMVVCGPQKLNDTHAARAKRLYSW